MITKCRSYSHTFICAIRSIRILYQEQNWQFNLSKRELGQFETINYNGIGSVFGDIFFFFTNHHYSTVIKYI